MKDNQSKSNNIRIKARALVESKLESPMVKFLMFLRLTPNTLTLIGLTVACLSAYLASIGLLLPSGLVLIASGMFDLLDGTLARATNQATKFGALLDSLTDRVSELIVLLGVMLFYINNTDLNVGIVLVYTSAAGSILVSYLRAKAESLNIECTDGIMTRPERVIMLSAGLIVGNWWGSAMIVALIIISALTIGTAIQRTFIIAKQIRTTDV
tara:strand:+ start:1201 stop:1836 length:636 start_codon:yes stop_codon:yes gene_type:complete